MTSTVVVTGGSGFIGTHLLATLADARRTRIFDTKPPLSRDTRNFVRGSVLDQAPLLKASKGCEIVVHLAGIVGVSRTESDPIQTLDVNVCGTRNVMEACRRNDVRKVILSSSSEVYGEPKSLPISETDSPMPITTYGVSKLVAEHYVRSYAEKYGLAYTILRFFNVYGPGQSTDFVLPKLVQSAVRSEVLVLHGDGSQVRAFCHVRDASDAIVRSFEKGDGEVLNIGYDKEPVSIKELAQKIVRQVGSKSKIRFQPFTSSGRKRSTEILNRVPSIARAREILGYSPKVTLEEGIASLVDSLR